MPKYTAVNVILTEIDTDKKTLGVVLDGNDRTYELLPEFTKIAEWEDGLKKSINESVTLKLKDGKVYSVST